MPEDNWERDEFLITLDLYYDHPDVAGNKDDPAVRDAASLIDRTPDSVGLRLANYRYLDPERSGGMSHVGDGCRDVWNEFEGRREALQQEADEARERLR